MGAKKKTSKMPKSHKSTKCQQSKALHEKPVDNADSAIHFDPDDCTPEVIVLLERLPQELLHSSTSSSKTSTGVGSLTETSSKNQSVPNELAGKSIETCNPIQIAIVSNDGLETETGDQCESGDQEKEAVIQNERDNNFPPASRVNLPVDLSSVSPVHSPALTITIDDEEIENINVNEVQSQEITPADTELEQEQPPLQNQTACQPYENICADKPIPEQGPSVLNKEGQSHIECQTTGQQRPPQTDNDPTDETASPEIILTNHNDTEIVIPISTRKLTETDHSSSKSSNTATRTRLTNSKALEPPLLSPLPIPLSSLIPEDHNPPSIPHFSGNSLKFERRPGPSSKKYRCSACGESFRLHLDLKEHLMKKHIAICMIYKCTICDSIFSRKEQLIQHIDKHCDCDPSSNSSAFSLSELALLEKLYNNTNDSAKKTKINLVPSAEPCQVESEEVDIELIDLDDFDLDPDEVQEATRVEPNANVASRIQEPVPVPLPVPKCTDSNSAVEREANGSPLLRPSPSRPLIITLRDSVDDACSIVGVTEVFSNGISHMKKDDKNKNKSVTVGPTTSSSIESPRLDKKPLFSVSLGRELESRISENMASPRIQKAQRRYNVRERPSNINYGESQICNRCGEDFLIAEELDDHARRCRVSKQINPYGNNSDADGCEIKPRKKLRYTRIKL